MKNIVNLTPHSLTIFILDGSQMKIEPSGIIARRREERRVVGFVHLDNHVPIMAITKVFYEEVENLPDQSEDTIFIVSSLVAQSVPQREDVFIPDTAVRDEEGRIIGVRGLAHI